MSHKETMPTYHGLGLWTFAVFRRISQLCIDHSPELTFETPMTSHPNEKNSHLI